jgi:hypothetical protein
MKLLLLLLISFAEIMLIIEASDTSSKTTLDECKDINIDEQLQHCANSETNSKPQITEEEIIIDQKQDLPLSSESSTITTSIPLQSSSSWPQSEVDEQAVFKCGKFYFVLMSKWNLHSTQLMMNLLIKNDLKLMINKNTCNLKSVCNLGTLNHTGNDIIHTIKDAKLIVENKEKLLTRGAIYVDTDGILKLLISPVEEEVVKNINVLPSGYIPEGNLKRFMEFIQQQQQQPDLLLSCSLIPGGKKRVRLVLALDQLDYNDVPRR